MKAFRFFALAGVSLLGMGSTAWAQDSSGDPAASSEDASDIIVTARRREESVQDIPLVVNAVSAEDIEKLNLRSGADIQALVPGLQLRTEPNGTGGSGQLRGVAYDINASVSPSVAFYLNDAPIDAGTILQAMYDIGQVEVLRGPQGTLRGTATPSGSITFTTRKPDLSAVGFTAQGTISNTGLTNFNGSFNIPIIQDVLGLRISGLNEESNLNRVHSLDPAANLDSPFAKTRSGRVVATLKPTDWFKLEGMYQITDRDTSSYDQYASFNQADPTAPLPPTLPAPGGTFNPAAYGTIGIKDRASIQETARITDQRFEVFNWRGEVRFGGQVAIYQGSRVNLDLANSDNQDDADFLPNSDVFQRVRTISKQTTHEFRVQNEERLFDMFDYVVGYYQSKQDALTNLTTETPVLLPVAFGGGIAAVATTPIQSGGITKEQAFFGNLTFHLGDATQISAGLRHIDLESPARVLVIGANTVPGGNAVDDEKFIYNASIQHNFTPDLMVYASTGTSRRAGPSIVNPGITQLSPLLRSFLFLSPEDSTSYEAGVKSSWLDDRLILNVSAFYQKFKNYAYKLQTPIYYLSFDANNVGTPTQSAQFAAGVPVTVKGIEAELAWKVSPNFNFSLTAAYADGKVKNGLVPCNDINGDDVPDAGTAAPTAAQLQTAYGADLIGSCRVSQRSSNQSPFSATAQAEYTMPLSDSLEVFGRGLLTYFGKSQVEPTSTFDDLGAYGLLNLYAGLRDSDGDWEFNIYAKNVFNTIKATRFDPPASTSFQRLNASFQASGQSATSSYSVIQTTAPRELGINFRVALGSR